MMPRRWLDVISNYPSVVRSSDKGNGSDHCLYYYDDLGPQGIQRWLYLRKHCEQGMDALYYLACEGNKLAIETQATTVGTMLECIGWFITCEKKQTSRMRSLKNGCKRPASFDDMLDALLEEFIVDKGVVEHNKGGKRILPKLAIPIQNVERWAMDIRGSYMSSKHPDAQSPSFESLYVSVRQAIVLARIWVGKYLGVDYDTMVSRLSGDLQARGILSHLETSPTKGSSDSQPLDNGQEA